VVREACLAWSGDTGDVKSNIATEGSEVARVTRLINIVEEPRPVFELSFNLEVRLRYIYTCEKSS
jgi:hypothetical protein